MTIPANETSYALKSKLDRAIDDFVAKDNPTTKDLEAVVVVAQVEAGLEAYRAKASSMTILELQNENHVSSKLAEHLRQSGDPRPNEYCHAHAIISGSHPQAVRLRATMAWLRMRIDDPYNGCWLPRNTAAKVHMPDRLRNAVPHSRIHRFNYYFWLSGRINLQRTPTFQRLSQELKLVEKLLQEHTFPPFVMAKKGEGLPA